MSVKLWVITIMVFKTTSAQKCLDHNVHLLVQVRAVRICMAYLYYGTFIYSSTYKLVHTYNKSRL